MVDFSIKRPIPNTNKETTGNLLRAVPYENGFHFFCTDGHYTGETAVSISTFTRDLERQDIESIRFHFERGDFQKWLKTTIGDEELAQKIDNLPKKVTDEALRKQLVATLQKRLSELQSAK